MAGNLEYLNVSANGIGDQGARALAGLPNTQSLKEINLDENAIGPEGARTLAASEGMEGIDFIQMSKNPVRAEGALEMIRSPHHTQRTKEPIQEAWLKPEALLEMVLADKLAEEELPAGIFEKMARRCFTEQWQTAGYLMEKMRGMTRFWPRLQEELHIQFEGTALPQNGKVFVEEAKSASARQQVGLALKSAPLREMQPLILGNREEATEILLAETLEPTGRYCEETRDFTIASYLPGALSKMGQPFPSELGPVLVRGASRAPAKYDGTTQDWALTRLVASFKALPGELRRDLMRQLMSEHPGVEVTWRMLEKLSLQDLLEEKLLELLDAVEQGKDISVAMYPALARLGDVAAQEIRARMEAGRLEPGAMMPFFAVAATEQDAEMLAGVLTNASADEGLTKLATKGLTRIGAGCLEALRKPLHARKKNIRLAAAQVLVQFKKHPEANTMANERLEKEKVKAVKAILESVVE